MDCTDLKYHSQTFDLIIDKSTIDALLCGDNSFLKVATMLNECQKVLKTGGYYVAISYGTPESREFHFQRDMLGWELQTFKIERQNSHNGQDSVHFVYICKKVEGCDELSLKEWEQIKFELNKIDNNEN